MQAQQTQVTLRLRSGEPGAPVFVLLLTEKQILPLRFTQGQDDSGAP